MMVFTGEVEDVSCLTTGEIRCQGNEMQFLCARKKKNRKNSATRQSHLLVESLTKINEVDSLGDNISGEQLRRSERGQEFLLEKKPYRI